MPKLSELSSNYLNTLVIGEWGTGKTTFAATFPKPIYWFDFDMGLQAIKGLYNDDDIIYDLYMDEDPKRPVAASAAEKKVNELLKDCQFKTVVVDTTTNLQDVFLARVAHANMRAGQAPQLQDYMKLMMDFKQFVYRTKALPCHTVFIAHEHTTSKTDDGTVRSLPLLSAKLASRLGGMFNEVYYTDVRSQKDGPEFRLLTGIAGIKKGKTQIGRDKFDLYEQPSFDVLAAKVPSLKGAQ